MEKTISQLGTLLFLLYYWRNSFFWIFLSKKYLKFQRYICISIVIIYFVSYIKLYPGCMFSRHGRWEMDVATRIADNNRVNGVSVALMRRFGHTKYIVRTWYRRCYKASKRGYYRRIMKERWILWRCDLFVGYAESV